MRRTRTALGALGALCALALILTGCSPKEARMSPEETRDALVALVHDSAAKLDATGWDAPFTMAKPHFCFVWYRNTYP